jgi:hypothetical protein
LQRQVARQSKAKQGKARQWEENGLLEELI